MSKQDLPAYFDSDAQLLAFLDDVEQGVLADFPRADKTDWRLIVSVNSTMQRERIALNVLVLARDLRERITVGMPAWEAVGCGMMLHDHMTAYKFPEFVSIWGKINAEKRKAKDGPVLSVLRYLKQDQRMTWKQSLRAIEDAAKMRTTINGIEVRRGRRKEELQFVDGDQSAKYKATTIERKYYGVKADP